MTQADIHQLDQFKSKIKFVFQIAVSIMQGVSAQFPCTWEEVLDFRRDHVGPPEQVSKALHGSVGEKVKNDFHEICTLPLNRLSGLWST